VAKMTEILLGGGPLHNVLEIGTGSGYQASVLARLVDKLYTVERIRPLQARARQLLQQLKQYNVSFKHADGAMGWVTYAPYDGIIVQRHAEVGEMVQPGQPLLTLRAQDKLRVLVDVPQTFIKTVRAQGRVHILVPGQSRPLEAAPLTIFPHADAVTHTVKVRADLPAGQAGIYPGMLVKAAFSQVTNQRLQIPYSAVVHRSEVTGVYVVGKDGRVMLRQIRVGQNYDDGMIEILAGLDVGEHIALDPVRATATLKQQRASKE